MSAETWIGGETPATPARPMSDVEVGLLAEVARANVAADRLARGDGRALGELQARLDGVGLFASYLHREAEKALATDIARAQHLHARTLDAQEQLQEQLRVAALAKRALDTRAVHLAALERRVYGLAVAALLGALVALLSVLLR